MHYISMQIAYAWAVTLPKLLERQGISTMYISAFMPLKILHWLEIDQNCTLCENVKKGVGAEN